MCSLFFTVPKHESWKREMTMKCHNNIKIPMLWYNYKKKRTSIMKNTIIIEYPHSIQGIYKEIKKNTYWNLAREFPRWQILYPEHFKLISATLFKINTMNVN